MTASHVSKRPSRPTVGRSVWVLGAGLLLSALAGLSLGAETVWPWEWWVAGSMQAELVGVWRTPRVMAAFLIGAWLALAGLVFQGVFRNPLAEPYLLGSASGAAVGAAIALLLPALVPLHMGLPMLAFLGAWGASWVVLIVGRMGGPWQSGRLLLAGVALAAILAALRNLILMVFGDESTNLRAVVSWSMGGVQTPTLNEVGWLALVLLISMALTRKLSSGLDALGMGEDTAHSMGIRTSRFTALAVTLAAFMTAMAVSWGGLIGFVGLIVPHVMRWWLGPLHKRLVPACAVAGGALMVLVDTVARAALAPSEIPAGLLTALIGGPFFLGLLLLRRPA